jgi:hypothetical protein
MGPIDELYERWISQQIAIGAVKADELDTQAWLKFVYYTACCDMFNITMTVIKGDHTLKALAIVSEAMRVNINAYIATVPRQIVN